MAYVLGTVTQFFEEIQLYPKKPHQYERLKLDIHEEQSQRKRLPLVIELLIVSVLQKHNAFSRRCASTLKVCGLFIDKPNITEYVEETQTSLDFESLESMNKTSWLQCEVVSKGET